MEIKRYCFPNYSAILKLTAPPTELYVGDHLGGFDHQKKNLLLDHLHNIAVDTIVVYHDQIFCDEVKKQYPKLEFRLEIFKPIWNSFTDYTVHPNINFRNFICSFNGSNHVSRKFLVAILERFGYFNPEYCSKNFKITVDHLDGHIYDYVADKDIFYRKFFMSADSDKFFSTINSFGHNRYNHSCNIYNLESKLTQSFLHVVSESMATSYVPFVTEKFLYSIVTRGLFLSYAQPGWHSHLEKYYGFKKYTKLFDYRFDNIQNPVERLLELVTMISKFDTLSPSDWHDLYLLQQDEIEYNYDHYFSQNYIKTLEKFVQIS